MRVGRSTSLLLLVVLIALAVLGGTVVASMTTLSELSPISRLCVIGGVFGAVFAVILIPLGFALDRTLGRLRHHVAAAAEGDTDEAFRTSPLLRPITHAFSDAVDQFRQRELTLRDEVRELEIRHRVVEAERRQLEAVLHALRDGVLVTDSFNELVIANAAAAKTLQFKLDGAEHQPLDDLIVDRGLGQLIRDTRDGGDLRTPTRVEHELPTADDERTHRLFDVTLTCVENHKRGVGGVVTILHDMTRERELSQMKSDFVSKASHELRTPLASIQAYVEMLVDNEATDEASRREFYLVIQNETERLGRMIDNMLNISRIEAGIVQIERETVDLRALVNRAVETLEPQARVKETSLITRTTDVDLCIEGDHDMLYQVLINLISNAVKYTPEGGRITVTADSDNLTRSVVVTVSDTGLGIPPDAIPRLFDKFYRVENFKRVAKGTGLGLNLCKHIVETVHHGQIGVESKLGMGSKFWFSVPMRYKGAKAA